MRSAALIAHAFITGGRDRPLQNYRQSPVRINGGLRGRESRNSVNDDAFGKPRASNSLRSARFTLGSRRKARMSPESMDDKPENVPAQPDLAAAIRQARVENAERAEAIADLRELEIGRLRTLEIALKPVVDQAPPDVDLFDLALAPGEHPRLFIDMIAYVDMGHDKRTYRFYQDTRHGRVLMAESQSADAIAAAVADYVARRLVERERALSADWRVAEAPQSQPEANGPRAWPIAKPRVRALSFPPAGAGDALASAEQPKARRRFAERLGDALSMFLMLLGSVTLALLIGLGAYWAWTTHLRDLWTQWIGAPPF
jgi:hypothetical protein